MARAKRTDRAEARRRHREELAAQELAAQGQADGDAGSTPDATQERPSRSVFGRRLGAPRPTGTVSTTGSGPTTGSAPTTGRVGFLQSFRTAYQIADVRADLRALPVLLRGRSFLIPLAASAASTVVALATVGTPNTITGLAVTLFLGPLPIGSIYAAGVLAPRASYLMSGLAAFFGTLGYVILALAYSRATSGGLTPGATEVFYAFLFYTFFGGVIGAGLGFYRRLLRTMNPGAGQRGAQRAKPKPSPRTR